MGEQSLVYSNFEGLLLKGLRADQDIILLSWDDLLFPFISQVPGFTLMEVFLTLLSSWASEMVLMMCSA